MSVRSSRRKHIRTAALSGGGAIAPPLSGVVTVEQTANLPQPVTPATSSASASLSKDGLHLVVTDTGMLYYYTLATAFDISNLTYVGSENVAASWPTVLQAIRYYQDGNTLLGIDNASFRGMQLNTPYDVTDGGTFQNSAQAFTNATGAAILNPANGIDTVIASRGGTGGQAASSATDLDVAFDASANTQGAAQTSPTFPGNISLGSFDMTANGQYMLVGRNDEVTVYVYELSTFWDVSTATLINTVTLPASNDFAQNLQVFEDEQLILGSKVIGNDVRITKLSYTGPPPVPLTGTIALEESWTPTEFTPSGADQFRWNNSGLSLAAIDVNADMYSWTCSVAYDPTTETLDGSTGIGDDFYSPQFLNSGNILAASYSPSSNDFAVAWSTGSPYDATSVTFFNQTSFSSEITLPSNVIYDDVGGVKFVIFSRGGSAGLVAESGIEFSSAYGFGSKVTTNYPQEVTFGLSSMTLAAGDVTPDGIYMLVFDDSAPPNFEVYEMSTPWDCSTATLINSGTLPATVSAIHYGPQLFPNEQEFWATADGQFRRYSYTG